MKLIKSNFAKKIIITLIILSMLISIFPNNVMAAFKWGDVGGLLMDPIVKFVLTIVQGVDAALGKILNDGTLGAIGSSPALGDIMEEFADWEANPHRTEEGWLPDNWKDRDSKYFISPDTIFSGDIEILNANVFEESESSDSLREKVRASVANIYVLLRNISAIIMLIGLVYTGIQILITSNIPTKKTQYLVLLQDWVMGMVLLIFSHIIMVIVFNISDIFVDAFKNSLTGISSDGNMNVYLIEQMMKSGSLTETIVYLILIIILVIQTIWFVFSYFKRMLYINVLVMFAPIFSTMYAFGQQTKQIYSKWIREYIMAVFIQPFHIIVYYVLILFPIKMMGGGTTSLLQVLYIIICILFIRPAENYLRGLFGMNQGVAGATSVEGGRQMVKGVADKALDFGKKAVAIGAAIYTGNAAIAAASMQGGDDGSDGGGTVAEPDGSTSFSDRIEKLRNSDKIPKPDDTILIAGTDENGNRTLNSMTHAEYEQKYGADKYDEFLQEHGYTKYLGQRAKELYSGNEDKVDEFFEDEGYSSTPKVDDRANTAERNADATEALTNQITQLVDNQNKDNANGTININAANVNMQGNLNFGNGSVDQGEIAGIKQVENANKALTGETSSEETFGLKQGPLTRKDKREIMSNAGVGTEVLKAGKSAIDLGHTIEDALYINPPPGDWKGTSGKIDGWITEREKGRKEVQEREKSSWAGNKANIAMMAEVYMPDMEKIYQGKPRAYIEDKAKEKAKTELVKMAEYVPYGITDVKTASRLYQDQKAYGFTPEQAIKNMAGYNKFNSNKGNIVQINKMEMSGKGTYTTVEAALPNARDYYSNGYTSVNEMAAMDYVARELKTSPEFAMKIHEALKQKGGEITYSGTDPDVKQRLEELNKNYKKMLKGMK